MSKAKKINMSSFQQLQRKHLTTSKSTHSKNARKTRENKGPQPDEGRESMKTCSRHWTWRLATKERVSSPEIRSRADFSSHLLTVVPEVLSCAVMQGKEGEKRIQNGQEKIEWSLFSKSLCKISQQNHQKSYQNL